MPTATKFSHLGWFPMEQTDPTCLEKVDVSGFDYWTTLGGVTKDSPTPTTAKIGESVENASKLFWNLYGATGTYFDSLATPQSTTTTIDANTDLESGSAEPVNRVCPDVSDNFGTVINLDDFAPINLHSSFYGGGTGSKCGLVRMYNGATTNEDNFVGYGIESDISTAFNSFDNPQGIRYIYVGAPPDLIIYVCSYGDDPALVGSVSDFAYTTNLEGIHFLVAATVAGAGGGETADATNLLVEAAGPQTVRLTLDSLEFYTYT